MRLHLREETECEEVAQDKDKWRASVNSVMNIRDS